MFDFLYALQTNAKPSNLSLLSNLIIYNIPVFQTILHIAEAKQVRDFIAYILYGMCNTMRDNEQQSLIIL